MIKTVVKTVVGFIRKSRVDSRYLRISISVEKCETHDINGHTFITMTLDRDDLDSFLDHKDSSHVAYLYQERRQSE